MIQTNNSNWKIGLAGNSLISSEVDAAVYDYSAIWSLFKHTGAGRGEKIGTVYLCCWPAKPNNFITSDSDPADNTWVAWLAQEEGFDGFLRWAYDFWWNNIDYFDQRLSTYASGDAALFYRSSNDADMKFYKSIRMSLIRDGIQDYEKIQILLPQLSGSELKQLTDKINKFSRRSADRGSIALVKSGQDLLKTLANEAVVNTQQSSTLKNIIGQVTPNPFTKYFDIHFKIPNHLSPSKQKIKIDIYDFKGRLVENIATDDFLISENSLHFRAASDLYKAGVYFLQINTGDYTEIQKIIKVNN